MAGLSALVVLTGSLWFVATRVESPDQAAADAKPPPATELTAPVEQRSLQQAVVTRGQVVVPSAVTVPVPVGDEHRPVVSSFGVEAGEPVEDGSVLAVVSGRPLIALYADFEMYRDLQTGDTGDDVEAIQAALVAAGRLAVTPSGEFDEVTATAIAAMYTDAGHTPPGESVLVASDFFTALKDPVVVSRLLAPLRRDASMVEGLLEMSDANAVVQVDLRQGEQAIVQPGTAAVILDEITGAEYDAVVDTVSDSTTLITPTPRIPLDQVGSNFRVTFTTAETNDDSLVVPVSAVVTAADGSTEVVQVAGDDHQPVRITPGVAVDGFVQIIDSTPDLEVGDQLVVWP
ncbi:MAG: peptidoglycan-binding protein [Actinomycetia bacterium]|nr:peptidoglycan-binding protein [Actinomycetes bacterium]